MKVINFKVRDKEFESIRHAIKFCKENNIPIYELEYMNPFFRV